MYSAVVKLYTPFDKTMAKLLEVGGIRIKKDTNGKERWKAIHRKKLINRSDIEILSKYNSEVRGLANYYSLACNPIRMAHFSSLMKYSMPQNLCCEISYKDLKDQSSISEKGHFHSPLYDESWAERVCVLQRRIRETKRAAIWTG